MAEIHQTLTNALAYYITFNCVIYDTKLICNYIINLCAIMTKLWPVLALNYTQLGFIGFSPSAISHED